MDIQKVLFSVPKHTVNPDLLNCARDQAVEWLELAIHAACAEELLEEYGTVDGDQEMKSNIDDVRAFLPSTGSSSTAKSWRRSATRPSTITMPD